MRMAVRLLFTVAVVGLVAGPARAHTIAVRGGGGSIGICEGMSGDLPGDILGDWLSLAPDEDDPDGDQESLVNDCGVAITSLDLQLSDFPDGDPLSHLSDLPLIAGDSVFDTFQVFATEAGSVLRFFSSTGNSFSSFCFECTPDGTHSAFFIFSVVPDLGDEAGYFRFVGFNEPPDAVVPEPASLLLLGSGLGVGAAFLKRRRRR